MSNSWKQKEYPSLYGYGSVPVSVWITLMYVLSIYLWPKHRAKLVYLIVSLNHDNVEINPQLRKLTKPTHPLQ